jgi:hypothetical protein
VSHPYLKGNYEVKSPAPAVQPAADAASLEEEFERNALQKLGGSIAFIKKSASFVWKGPQRDRTR